MVRTLRQTKFQIGKLKNESVVWEQYRRVGVKTTCGRTPDLGDGCEPSGSSYGSGVSVSNYASQVERLGTLLQGTALIEFKYLITNLPLRPSLLKQTSLSDRPTAPVLMPNDSEPHRLGDVPSIEWLGFCPQPGPARAVFQGPHDAQILLLINWEW